MTRPLRRPAAALTTLVIVVTSLLMVSVATPAQARDHAPQDSAVRLPAASSLAAGEDASMYLRRLALSKPSLRGSARKQADALTARPRLYGERIICSATAPICVHYASAGADAPRTSAITPQVVLSNLEHIYAVYQSSGYRMPEADHTTGGGTTQVNGLPVPADDVDIYLANIGSHGYYGYCAPEPLATSPNAHHTPAFCVLENDFAEFHDGTALSNLQVTAAHEFFHAVQFAYDASEDPWFMESTAVWVEDQVFDSINDNTQYLPYGPLGKPSLSLDKNTTFGVYGGWIFFRWVTEHRPALVGKMPGIIRSMWERAAAGSHDHYSLQAVAGALKAAGLPLRTAFARFAADNRAPRSAYSEGRANRYPIAAPANRYRLSGARTVTGTSRVSHLAAATERFTPRGRHLRGKHARLRLTINMDDTARGSAAIVTIYPRHGHRTVRTVHLNRRGGGSTSVPFSSRRIKRVELTMSNASTRMQCWVGARYSCQGQPRDMRVKESFAAQVRP
ncbi:MXAN_6640 family putative metalloprotease [Nocardioides nematodiphilus]|uniref:MXAN_6640 family putative metalloprotease n=1 Tax=Nocardioides nematodiphilus TaxID=2849669 RepID=UPI001CDA0F83|nr:MXAN_6640 family putative metalloprotease [Nocardioides nematodiphilus]MCA1981404.1 hypothetical protein [Nocardioides nematodiphilus]